MKGGARQGAGRPKGTSAIKAEKAREYFVARVVAELEPLLAKMLELANNGDANMLRYLVDQTIGKAKETQEQQIVMELKVDF